MFFNIFHAAIVLSIIKIMGYFEFNIDLLKTNLFNLVMVLIIVITFVSDALRGLLMNRKQIILNNFYETNQRVSEVQERLNKAKFQLEQAKIRAQLIREQVIITIKQEKNQFVRQTKDDIKRLTVFQQKFLEIEQQKAQNELALKLVHLASNHTREILAQHLSSVIQGAVSNFQIVLFTKYKPY